MTEDEENRRMELWNEMHATIENFTKQQAEKRGKEYLGSNYYYFHVEGYGEMNHATIEFLDKFSRELARFLENLPAKKSDESGTPINQRSLA